MEILKQSGELSTREIYALTRSSDATSIKDLETASEIEVEKYLAYKDKNSKGEDVTILALMDTNGKIYATVSETFMKEFDFITHLISDEIKEKNKFSIRTVKGMTKAKKEFVTCNLI